MYRILLIDDEQIALEAIQMEMDWEQLQMLPPLTAGSVDAAKKQFQSHTIDVMICDIEMPGEDGISLLKWVKRNYPACICIFLTSHDDFSYAQQSISLGLFDYLLKPVSHEKLKSVLERAILELVDAKYVRQAADIFESSVEKVKEGVPLTDDVDQIVEKAKKYIWENIGSNIHREDIADYVYLNPDYVSRIFRKKTGLTIKEYITKKRVSISMRILATTTMPICKLASSLGYVHMGHFSQVFKDAVGMTPNEYRKKCRNTEDAPDEPQ